MHEWKCLKDEALYKQIIEKKYVFKFLMGVNKDLDEVYGRILGTKSLPTIQEVILKVRLEESHQKVMM